MAASAKTDRVKAVGTVYKIANTYPLSEYNIYKMAHVANSLNRDAGFLESEIEQLKSQVKYLKKYAVSKGAKEEIKLYKKQTSTLSSEEIEIVSKMLTSGFEDIKWAMEYQA